VSLDLTWVCFSSSSQVTGCLTNAALLFNTFPDVVGHIAGLTIMGGAVGGGFTNAPMGSLEGEGERFGNWSHCAEFNIYIDPESAQSIFSNPILAAKTTIAPLDLTHQMVSPLPSSHGIIRLTLATAGNTRSLSGAALRI
jgi:uridine nucleosidase